MADLREYRRKRDPARTPEPFEPEPAGGAEGRPRFVVQRHSATSLHYDLRLERDGVLESWAVPKGLPLTPGARRLAVHTEDHPLTYLDFEGVIPKGEYGAGTMDVYDTGTYEEIERKRSGELTVRLHGRKLRGTWTLVPQRRRDDRRDWLLLKRHDDGGPAAPPHERYLPMLATPADTVPRGKGWLFEVKWDGYRTLARLDGGDAVLWSRRGNPVTEQFSPVAKTLGRGLRVFDCVVDGEVCALDAHGRPSFQLLQRGRGRLVYFVFDLLELEGEPLLRRPLRERRELLAGIVDPRQDAIRLSDAFDDGAALLEVAREQGLEGIVAKRAASAYRPGARTRSWLKVKAREREELKIAGYTYGEGTRERLGSLVLGVERGGRLEYAGNVGAGLSEPEIDRLLQLLEPLRRKTPPFARRPDDPRLRGAGVVWVEPELAAEVEFAEWTEAGVVRAPAYKGLAETAAPTEIEVRKGRRSVRLTHLDRPFWPEQGIVKGDLVEYYRGVADVLLPHLRDRPFTMKRHWTVPHGPFEWAKDAPPELPAWVPTCPQPAKSRGGALVRYPLVQDELCLLAMIELGCVDLHVWPSRCDRPDRPDWVLFDLDPAGVGFASVERAALLVRDTLAALGLESLPRTTGGEGMHVLVPIARRHTHEQAREFARIVAGALARTHPDLITVQTRKDRRHGVYVDVKMNGHGQQVVAPYSVRPLPGAPVATPLRWSEVGDELDPASFTMEAVRARIERHGDLAAGSLGGRQRLDRALATIAA
jgi:bifunctional non-homologous end joining protein LigD